LINPSADITERTAGFAAGGVWVRADLFVSALCSDAQPNRGIKQMAATNQALRFIREIPIKTCCEEVEDDSTPKQRSKESGMIVND
jgi:hypothetical protein